MFEEASRQIGFEEITPAGKPQNFWTTYYTVHADGTGYRNVIQASSGTEVAS